MKTRKKLFGIQQDKKRRHETNGYISFRQEGTFKPLF